MNPINMNLLYAVIINIIICCLDTTAISQGDTETVKDTNTRKNYTANDLIAQLSKLASLDSIPRQRFPPNVYEDYPDDSNFQNPPNNPYGGDQQYYQQNYFSDYQNYPPNSHPYRRRPGKIRYPHYPQYPFQDGASPGFDQYPQSPFPFGPSPLNPYQQGPFESLTRALGSIARYDDQQCVPRLLCEVAAGSNPSGKQNSLIPSFLSMDSLFTLLSAFAGEQVSPFLIFGRAAVLGVTSQGNPSSCRYAYPECPRDPDRLVDYLNNHNGGFFRFFNGIQEQQPGFNFPQEEAQQSYLDQTNQQNYPQNYQQNPQQNYQQNPQQNNQLYYQQNNQQNPQQNNQQYNPGQKYPQYSYDNYNERPQNNNQYYNKRKQGKKNRFPHRYESRILNENTTSENEARIQNKPSIYANQDLQIAQSYHYPNAFQSNQEHAFKFPESSVDGPLALPNINSIQSESYLKFPYQDGGYKKIKSLLFPGQHDDRENHISYYPKPLPFYDHTKMIFPDRTGTGNLKFDLEKLHQSTYRPDIDNRYVANYYAGNYNKPNYYYSGQHQSAASTSDKKYVYIVRGNGDPNNPEKVPIEYARNAKLNEDNQAEEATESTEIKRHGKSWIFPSTHEGVTYNDRSFTL